MAILWYISFSVQRLKRAVLCAHRPQGLQEGQLGLDRLLLLVNTFLETKNTRQSISQLVIAVIFVIVVCFTSSSKLIQTETV